MDVYDTLGLLLILTVSAVALGLAALALKFGWSVFWVVWLAL